MPPMRALARPIVCLAFLGSLSACGGGDATSPSAPALTAQEARAVAVAIFDEIDRALGDSVGVSATRLAVAPQAGATRSLAFMPTFTSPVNSSCQRGGTLSGTLTFTDNTDAQGTGTITEALAITPHGCVVPTGTRNIAVNGQINLELNATLVNAEPTSELVMRTTGKLTWDGGSCDLDYSLHFTVQGAVTLTGTVCGQSVAGSASL